MSEMHLWQPGFTYNSCVTFTKNKERIQKLKETGDSGYIHQNEARFQHDTAYEDSKDLTRRTDSYKILRDKASDIVKNLKYDGFQRGFASMVYKCFDKKSASLADKSASGSGIKNENMSNKELAKELHKPITGKFKKKKSIFIFCRQYLAC